jgi:hypothetical protein
MSANMQRLQKELSAWRIQNAMGERDPTMLDNVINKGMELLRRDEERNPQFPIGESPTDKKARLATQEANAEQRKNELAELLVGVQERIDAQTKALLETDPAKAKDSLIAAGKTSFAKNKILASEGDRDIPIIELQNKIADKLQKIEDAFQARNINESQRDRLKAGNLKGFERQRDALVRKQMTEMFNSLVDKGISLGEAFDATVEKFDASGVSLQGRKTFAENLAKSRVATDEKFNREDLRGVNANQRARRARERALEIRNAKQRKAEADRKAKEAKEAQLRDPRKRKGAALFVPDVEIKANEVSSRVVNMEPPKVRFAGSRGSLGSRGDTGALGSGQGVSRRTMSVDVEAFKRERSFSRVMNDAAKATAKETERLFNKMDRQQGLMPDFTNDSQPMPAGASERLFRILDEVNRQNDFDRVMDDSVQPTAREIQGLFDKLSTINDERDKVFKKLKLPSIGVSLAKANEPVVDAITGLELLPIGIPSGDQSRRTQDLFENNNLIKTGGPTSEDIDFAVRNFAEGLLKFAPGGINNRGFGRATGGNNPGFNGLGPIRNENPFRTRSGRLKSTRRGARTSAAGFFSRPSALPRGVVRNRRGTSLFEREQSNRPGTTGTRFSGQTAQGLLAARRRRTDGVTPSMVQREAPKAKDTQSQTFAQEANTVALDANKQATEANTAAVREVPATLAKAVLGAFGVPFPGSNNPGDTDVANNTPAKGSGFGVT